MLKDHFYRFKNDFILDLLNKENKGLTDDDAVPEKPINPKSKIGDVWLLGNHRLVCGDSTLPENTELMFKGQTMDFGSYLSFADHKSMKLHHTTSYY